MHDGRGAARGQGIDTCRRAAYDQTVKKFLVAILFFCACLLVSAATGNAPSPTIETVPASGTYVVNNDHVNVRVAPDVKNGKVIGQLNKGTVVDVQEMTKLVSDVNGTVAAWFHVKSPNGWVFGWYLDPLE
jgi:hypothetical protein